MTETEADAERARSFFSQVQKIAWRCERRVALPPLNSSAREKLPTRSTLIEGEVVGDNSNFTVQTRAYTLFFSSLSYPPRVCLSPSSLNEKRRRDKATVQFPEEDEA